MVFAGAEAPGDTVARVDPDLRWVERERLNYLAPAGRARGNTPLLSSLRGLGLRRLRAERSHDARQPQDRSRGPAPRARASDGSRNDARIPRDVQHLSPKRGSLSARSRAARTQAYCTEMCHPWGATSRWARVRARRGPAVGSVVSI